MSNETTGTIQRLSQQYSGGKITTMLLLGGVVLFLIPEPITSVLGTLLILFGLGAWAINRFAG